MSAPGEVTEGNSSHQFQSQPVTLSGLLQATPYLNLHFLHLEWCLGFLLNS